jgi:hypothetical protein
MRGALGSSLARSAGSVVCSDRASAGLTRPCGSRSKTRRSPTVEKTRFLVADAPVGAQQLDRLEHVVEIVGRFAHAHEHHPLDRAQGAGQRHLGDELGAAELAQQAVAAGHAEQAADGATDLGGNTESVTRQQHTLHRLTVRQRHQQAQ